MPLYAPNKFVTAGYPSICPCGVPTPCEATVDEDGYPTVTCEACGRGWTYYEMVGWSQDSECGETQVEREAREEAEIWIADLEKGEGQRVEVYLRSP